MLVKAGLGLIGLSAISVGGVALANPAWLGMKDPMPDNWHPLTEDENFSDGAKGYSDGKFGKKYGKYLVGVSKSENKDWWEWAFRRLNNENTKPAKFAGVGKGYDSNNDDTALNKVCKKAFETETTNGFATGNEADKFNKSDVWKYCSPGLLTNTNKDKYDSQKIGGDNSNKAVLISVKDDSNDWFWEKRNEDFWAKETSNEWSGNGASGSEDTDKSIFKKEYENKNSSTDGTRKTIKELCGEAYTQQANPDSNNNNKDAKKFCALEASGS